MRIAAIIPVYNGKRFLRETVASVRAQTLAPAELVVVDDGSSDGSLDVLKDLELPFPLITLSQANAGQSAARNRGARQTSCELFALLDQDDAWHPTHLEQLSAHFAEHGDLGWVYSNVNEMDESGRPVRTRVLDTLMFPHPLTEVGTMVRANMHVLPSAALFRRAAFLEVGGFDERLSGYEDDDLFLRMFRAGFQSVYVSDPSVDWRVWPSSSAHSQRMTNSERIYAQKLIDAFPAELVRELIAPRFLGCAWDRYKKALARRDWPACEEAAEDAARYTPLITRELNARLKVELMRRPRAYAALQRLSWAMPRRLRQALS